MTKGEKITNIVLLLALIVFFIEAQRIPAGLMIESVRREVGADFWPKALLVILLILTGILNVKSFFTKKDPRKNDLPADTEEERWWNFVILILSIGVYLQIQYVIGFIASTFLLSTASIYILGYRRKIFMISISVVVAFLFAYIFGKFLGVPFPRGYGLFRNFELLVY